MSMNMQRGESRETNAIIPGQSDKSLTIKRSDDVPLSTFISIFIIFTRWFYINMFWLMNLIQVLSELSEREDKADAISVPNGCGHLKMFVLEGENYHPIGIYKPTT